MIEVDSVSASFRDRTGGAVLALNGVSTQFQSGKFCAVIGPSGSGKTTLIHVIAGILKPNSGRIVHDGVVLTDLSEAKRDAWRLKHIGMIFQDFRLIEELSPLQNVLVPAWFGSLTTPPAHRERAAQLLESFQVPTRSGPVAMLSRGQQQRVALARALLLDPEIILADEPTSSVDKNNAQAIIDAMRQQAGLGKLVICVSHDDRVAEHADRVIEIRDGVIVGDSDQPDLATIAVGAAP